jgi:hypothetical protein
MKQKQQAVQHCMWLLDQKMKQKVAGGAALHVQDQHRHFQVS